MLNSLGAERKPKGKQISMNMKLSHFICRRWRSAICTGTRRKALFMSIFAINVPVTIQSTLFRACGDHLKHNSALAEHITILHSWRQYKAHYSALAEHITIPHSWRQYKAHYSALVETTLNTQFRALAEHITNSTLVETIQGTLFRTCGGHIKHTILHLRRAHYDTYNITIHVTSQYITLQYSYTQHYKA